ncbi:MAG TPA: EpsD family peptidyl-prolyl cis-trans isomerase [Burkholderiales bacterium]|nr:EpsD family peptidyl-prolyl cis-trans isomerase [Burkholderiales bacterium]
MLALAASAGCGKKDDAKGATQVAAKVNSDEITVHQVNNVLARSQNAQASAQGKREVLDKLIDQQLAVQKAIERKLDRSPAFVQAIEAARNELLARAYLEQIASEQIHPTPFAIQKYYAMHLELFAERRIFDLEECVFLAKEDLLPALRDEISRSRSLGEIAGWLRTKGVQSATTHSVRAAEQISLEILPKLQAMKPGELRLFEVGGGRYEIIRLVSYTPEPVDEATASKRIDQYLFNKEKSEAVAKEIQRLRGQAKIEYAGEFAATPSAKPETAKPKAD